VKYTDAIQTKDIEKLILFFFFLAPSTNHYYSQPGKTQLIGRTKIVKNAKI